MTWKDVDENMGAKLTVLLGDAARYLMTIKITDILDILIMAFVIYKLLNFVKTSRVANLLKGVFVFLVVLWLSTIFHLNGINYIMGRMVEWGVLALIILFQPEIRRVLEQVGSRRFAQIFTRGETEGAWSA